MAKTPEQKAAAREASLLKKAAHSARARELHEAEEEARARAANTPVAQEFNAADAAAQAARDARDALVNNIEVQISLLRDRVKEVRAEHDPHIEHLHTLRCQIGEKACAESRRLLDEAQSRFPDMRTCDMRWSSSVWVPPEGYVERFAAEHAEELAQKKARRENRRPRG